MAQKIEWYKLYLFAGVACGVLFLIPPDNQAALFVWLIAAFGGIGLWLLNNQSRIARQSYQEILAARPPVNEFFDEDRIAWQAEANEPQEDDLQITRNKEL